MAKIKRDPRLMALAKQFLEIYKLLLTDDVYYCLKEMLGGTIESMFEAEMDDHLGFPKGISADQPGNTRNGFSKQNAKSNGEPIEVNIPRDRKSEFDPKITGKYKTDISDIEEKISPCMPKEWQTRPLEAVYPVVFLDAIHYHVRQDGAIVKKAVYNIMAYTMDGTKDILITCIDGLTGFKEAINAVFPKTRIQRCIIHQIRSSTGYVSYKDIKAVMADLKLVYKASTEKAASANLDKFEEK